MDSKYQDKVICPWCGSVNEDAPLSKDHGLVVCKECSKKYYFDTVYVYEVEKVVR